MTCLQTCEGHCSTQPADSGPNLITTLHTSEDVSWSCTRNAWEIDPPWEENAKVESGSGEKKATKITCSKPPKSLKQQVTVLFTYFHLNAEDLMCRWPWSSWSSWSVVDLGKLQTIKAQILLVWLVQEYFKLKNITPRWAPWSYGAPINGRK